LRLAKECSETGHLGLEIRSENIVEEGPFYRRIDAMNTQLDMIGIFVKDIHQMVAFYRDVLGFEIDWDGKGPYAEFKHKGIRFSMYERAQLPALLGQNPTYPTGLNGTFELAFDLPTSADVDLEFERVVKAGGQPIYAPRNEPWGMYSSMITDPEGNIIEIGSWNRGVKSKSQSNQA
jgi:lactoylglutathione lyase